MFCSECKNLLLPAEDIGQNRLKYICRTCDHSEYADEYRVYYNSILHEEVQVGDIQPENLVADCTLPRARVRCRNCDATEAIWFQTDMADAEKMILTFVCINCKSSWST